MADYLGGCFLCGNIYIIILCTHIYEESTETHFHVCVVYYDTLIILRYGLWYMYYGQDKEKRRRLKPTIKGEETVWRG